MDLIRGEALVSNRSQSQIKERFMCIVHLKNRWWIVHVTSAVQSLSNNVIHTKPLSHTEEGALRYGMFYYSTFNLAEENGYGTSLSLEASPWFPAGSILNLKSDTSKKKPKRNNKKTHKQNCHPKFFTGNHEEINPSEEEESVLFPLGWLWQE